MLAKGIAAILVVVSIASLGRAAGQPPRVILKADKDTGRKYITAKKATDKATSSTLVTCFCYNRYDAVGGSGSWPAWYGSHIRGTFQHAVGRPMHPAPNGLAVGYLDGSVRFVKWGDLTPSNHEGEYLVYYDAGT